MHLSWSKLGFLFSIIILIPSEVLSQQTVILVRHADRDAGVPDGLTKEGRMRAETLASTLKDAGVTHVVRSNTIRTRETALPTVQARGIPEKVINADDNHVKNAYEAIRTSGANAVVLYVGHSNTVGPLLAKLGYKDEITIGEQEFGNMYILVPKEPNSVLIKLHYGK